MSIGEPHAEVDKGNIINMLQKVYYHHLDYMKLTCKNVFDTHTHTPVSFYYYFQNKYII